MVRVTWSRDDGQVHEIRSGDGPGDYTDDVDPDDIDGLLSGFDTISEKTIAAAVMGSYEGELSSEQCQVAADTYPDREGLVTTIAFVELMGPENKLSATICPECSFSPDEGRELYFEAREEDGWIYDDAHCPECDEVVHVELVFAPE
jgi:hypothetical protein